MIKLPLEVTQGFWERQPGSELCVKECGAYCCRNGFEATIKPDEIARLNAKLHGCKINVYWHAEKKRWRWLTGKPCLFLITSGPKKNMCSIHDVRPDCCRRFPHIPTDFCAVWRRR